MRWLQQLLFLSCVSVFNALSAHAEPIDAGYATVEIISERQSVGPGETFMAALKLDIDDEWHVYWRNAGDAGIAPSIRWDEGTTAETGEFFWPAPHTIPLEGLMNYGYGKQVVLPFQVTAPDDLAVGDVLQMTGRAEWQICKDVCIWEDADIAFAIPVAAIPEAHEENAALISASLETAPMELSGEAHNALVDGNFRLSIADSALRGALENAAHARFFPYEHQIEHFPEQPIRMGEKGATFDLKRASLQSEAPTGIEGVVVVENKDHALRSYYVKAEAGDVLPGTDNAPFSEGVSEIVLVNAAASATTILSWLFFAFVGGLILNLMPCVLPVLTIKANGLAHAAQHGTQGIRAHGMSYLAGVLVCFAVLGVGLLFLRSAGQQVGLGFQLQYPPMVLGLSLLMFLVGLNLLGVFEIGMSFMNVGADLAHKQGTAGAFFTGLLAAIVGAPCVGPLLAASLGAVVSQPVWVVMLFLLVMGAGMASPFVVLSFIPGLARALPKPGKWMETLKQVLAFPMFLTAVWLLWVFAGQKGQDAAIIVLAAAVALGFGGWLFGRAQGGAGKASGGTVLVAALIAPFILTASATVSTDVKTDATTFAEANVETAEWSREAVAKYRKEGRPVFIDFTARWCVTCQMNKRVTLHSDKVMRAFADNDVVFMTADWTNRDADIAAELAVHERAGVPLYLFYGSNLEDPVVLPQILSAGLVVKTVSGEGAS